LEGHGPHGAHPRAAHAAAGHGRARLEELFGPEEYRQVVAYHYGMARHHLFKAQTSRDHAKARDGLQLPLFGEEDDEGAA